MKVEFENFESFIDFLRKIPEESLYLLLFSKEEIEVKSGVTVVTPNPKPNPTRSCLTVVAFTKIGTFAYKQHRKKDEDSEVYEKAIRELGGVEMPNLSYKKDLEKIII